MIKAQFVLTESCNLSCSYCYVHQKNNYMSKETFASSFASFKKSVGSLKYNFDFFGGEPLLNWDTLVSIIEELNKDPLCVKKMLVTNGLLLTQEKVDFLKKNKVRCMISFDGLWSDKRGKDLIPKYLEKKSLFKQLTNSFNTMLHPDNLNIVENYNFIVSEFEMIPNFKLIRDDVWKERHVDIFRREFKALCERYEYLLVKENKNYLVDLIQYYLYLLKIGLVDKVKTENCGAGTEIYCYSPEGEKFPCARYATNNEKEVGSLVFEECSGCKLESFCEKGCLYQNNKSGINKNLCKIYECIFEEVVELNYRLKTNLRWKQIVRNLGKEISYE